MNGRVSAGWNPLSVLPDHSEILYAELVRRDEAATSEHGRRLAELWAQQLAQVITRVFEIAYESGRAAWHVDARTEATFELAGLLRSLSKRIVDHRLQGRTAANIDLAEERAALNAPDGLERIENTAQIVAGRIWTRIYDELHKKYPLVRKPGENAIRRLPGRWPTHPPPGTQENHFVPRFTIRPWADADGRVREFRRLANGRIRSRLRPFARWGFEHFLYPQGFEEYLQRVETRAAGPYQQVLQSLPLTPDDRYFWITFLIFQHLRTPAYMAAVAAGLRRQIISKRWPYPTTPEAMRRAYLTLFEQDDLFSAYYRRLDGHRWRILVAAAGMSFPRTDVPLVLKSSATGGGWHGLYPVSPERCFQVGPERAAPSDVPSALSEMLTTEKTVALNVILLSHARRSAVVRTVDDPAHWSAVLGGAFRGSTTDDYRAWGPLTAKG